MTSQDLVASFNAHLTALGGRALLADAATHVAVLFGTDEFRVDWKRAYVELPIQGVLRQLELESACSLKHDDFDWVAITSDRGAFDVIFGTGNPYSSGAEVQLPVKEGITMAIPNAVSAPLGRTLRRRLSRNKG